MPQVPDPETRSLPLDPNLIYLPAEIAAYLRVAVRTLQSWRHRGGGPPFRKYGELVRYKGSAVLEWDASRSRRTTSDAPGLRAVRREEGGDPEENMLDILSGLKAEDSESENMHGHVYRRH